MGDIIRAYHFVGNKLRDGRTVPADGEWLVHDGKLKICESGLHASLHPFDALQYAPGPVLCLVDVRGLVMHKNDKLCAEERCIVARFDATKLLWQFARNCALNVVHLWNCPVVVKRFLETGDESLRDTARAAAKVTARVAARDVARDAALAAARDAAKDTALAAARVAARDAALAAARNAAWDVAWEVARIQQKSDFKAIVNAEFAKIGKVRSSLSSQNTD